MDPVTLRIQAEVDNALTGIKKTRDAYLNFQSDYKKANAEMAKVTSTVFGDASIRKALQYAKAVEAVGGASRLTAKEQKAVNIVVTEAIDKYTKLGKVAPAALTDIAKATKQVETETKGSFGELFSTIAGGVTVGNILANGIQKALSSIVNGVQTAVVSIGKAFAYLVDRGADVDQIRQAFVHLTNDIGQVPEKLLAAGREGVRGLVTDFDLMKSANQAMLFGLEVTEKEFFTLTRAAQTLGRAMGQDATKSLNDLIVALGRTSPRILDNLGIIVKVGEANTKYADSIGKTVKELSAEQRQHAFYVESMRKIEEKVSSLVGLQLTLRDRVTQATIVWKNFTDSLAVAVSVSPVLTVAFEEIFKVIQKAFGVNQVETVQKLVTFINHAAIAAVQFANVVTQAVTSIAAVAGPQITGQIQALATFMETLQKTLHGLRIAYSFLAAAPGGVGEPFRNILPVLRSVDDELYNIAQTTKNAAENSGKLTNTIITGGEETRKFLVDLEKKMKAQLNVKVEATKIVAGLMKLQQGLNDETEQETKLTAKQLKELEKKKKKMQEITEWTQGLKLDVVDKWFAEYANEGKILYKKLTEDYNWIEAWDKQFDKLKSNISNADAFLKGLKWTDMFKGDGTNPDPVKKPMDSLVDGLKEATRMFSQLKQVSGDTWGGMIKDLAETLQLMEIGASAGKTLRDTFYDSKKFNTGTFDKKGNPIYQGGFSMVGFKNSEGGYDAGSIAGGVANTAAAAYQGYGSLMQATSSSSRGKNIGKGAMSGAAIGNSIVPGYGALVGAAVGAIVGALRGGKLRDEIKVIGGEWGLTLGDEMAKKIVDTAKEKFKGDRRTAEVFLMDEIIGQGGGVTDKNRKRLEGQLKEVFSAVETGKMEIQDARGVLDKNFQTFADHYQKTGKVISKEMREIIRLNGELKTQSETIKNFVVNQMDAIGKGVMGMVAPAVKSFAGISDEIAAQKEIAEAAKKELEALDKKEGGGGLEDTAAAKKAYDEAQAKVDALTTKQKEGAASAKESWETAGLAALKAINAASKQGLTYDEAFEQAGDSLSVLVGLQRDLGLTTENSALAGLIKEQELTEKYADRIQQVKSLNETTVALANLNALDVEMLAKMQVQGKATYDSLIEAGFTEEQTLRRMVPFLEAQLQVSKEQNVALDENTQAYVDQATSMGLLGDKAKDTNGILGQGFRDIKEGIGALITTLGGELPKAWQDAADAVKKPTDQMVDGVTEIGNRVGQLPDRFRNVGKSAQSAADEAVDAMGRVGKAARGAQYDVDGVSTGHSPGGFKDIKPYAMEALKATQKWRNASVSSARDVQDAIDNVNMAAIDGKLIGPEANRPISLAETYQFSFAPNVIDGTDLKDMVENEITPFVLSAFEANRRGALTRARQALGI